MQCSIVMECLVILDWKRCENALFQTPPRSRLFNTVKKIIMKPDDIYNEFSL